MRHQRSGKKLGRDSAHRKALYANLAGALIEHGRIKTTVTKAKAVKPIAEQMITLGRRGDIHARRQAVAFLRSKDVVHKLFAEVGPRFAERPGRLLADRASSARARATPPRWSTSSSSTRRSSSRRGSRATAADARPPSPTERPRPTTETDGGRRARGARPRTRSAEAEAEDEAAEAEAEEPRPSRGRGRGRPTRPTRPTSPSREVAPPQAACRARR